MSDNNKIASIFAGIAIVSLILAVIAASQDHFLPMGLFIVIIFVNLGGMEIAINHRKCGE